MIISRTPYRLSLFGGGTDYKDWYRENGALIIATAMTKYCYISVRRLPPFFEHRTRVSYSKIEEVVSAWEIRHPSVRNCLLHLNVDEGLEIHYDGDMPARSGIGSSSTFTVGLLNALHALQHQHKSPMGLAREAIYVEQELNGESVGVQDQLMAAHGGFRIIEIYPDDHHDVHPLVLSPEYQQRLENHVLLAFSGFSRTANGYAKKQIENIRTGRTESPLSEIHDIAKEAKDLLEHQSDLCEIGSLLHRSWELKRGLCNGMSNGDIDDLYKTARRAGAYGGKLMGAGGGGFIMLFADPECHDAIRRSLPKVKVWVPFRIAKDGSRIVFHSEPTDDSDKVIKLASSIS